MGKQIRIMTLEEFDYDAVVSIAPHGDDNVLGCGGFAKKLHEFRPDVPIYPIVLTPGYRGVTDQWLSTHQRAAEGHLRDWLGVDSAFGNSGAKLLHAFEDQVVGDIEAYGADKNERLANALKTAIRWHESRNEICELNVNLDRFFFLPLAKMYRYKRVFADEIGRLTGVLNHIATTAERPLLLTPHPDDNHKTHRVATEYCIRSLGAGAWDVWHYATPWFDLPDVTTVVRLTNCELGAKVDAAQMHESQLVRTKYDTLVPASASKNAHGLPEKILDFGADSQDAAFGDWCEVYVCRDFYARDPSANCVSVFSQQFASAAKAAPHRGRAPSEPISVGGGAAAQPAGAHDYRRVSAGHDSQGVAERIPS